MTPLEIFKDFSRIPRGSGNERGIADYLMQFAQARGLTARRDALHNVVVYKPAQHRDGASVILQSHSDMVCEKTENSPHDFDKDPIDVVLCGDLLRARDTTLGADNGAGLAITLAVLADTTSAHPPLEAVFTADEETGMTGVAALDAAWLTGRRMINLDSGEEGTFCVGCAGGVRAKLTFAAKYETNDDPLYRLRVRGLRSGHSGTEIHLEQANALVLLARVLTTLQAARPALRVASLSGGTKQNVIPLEAEAVFAVPDAIPSGEIHLEALVAAAAETLRREYRDTDPNLVLSIAPIDPTQWKTGRPEVLTATCTQNTVRGLLLVPNGPLFYSKTMPGLVETSNNLGVLTTTRDAVTLECALRGSVASRLAFLQQKIAAIPHARVDFTNAYPGWEYNPDSTLRTTAVARYTEMFGTAPRIHAIHAGLECGYFLHKIPGLDILSIGPDIHDAHTTNETLSVSSLERVWRFTTDWLGVV